MSGFGVTIADLRTLVESRVVQEEFEPVYKRFGGFDGIVEGLKTSPKDGIKSSSIEERRAVFGANEMPQKKPASYAQLAWEACQDATLIMLIVSAIFSLVLGMIFEDPSTGWVEGTAIMFAVVVVVNVTAGNDYVKERQFLALNATMEDEAVDVVRDGHQMAVSVLQLVVGDVVELKVGDNLGADGLLIQGSGIKCDEMSQTGETDLIPKSKERPVLLSGTKVMEGTGRMLVLAVGRYSQSGIIKDLILHGREGGGEPNPAEEAGAALSAASPSETAAAKAAAEMEEGGEEELTGRSVLGTKLDKLAVDIGKAGGVVALMCVVVMYIRFFSETWPGGDDEEFKDEYPSQMLSFVITGITILVVAVPEGLPLAVTISLAFSGHRMLADNNLVKHLDACETMGSATMICSDKTGTLTTSRMTVTKIYLGGEVFQPEPSAAVKGNAGYVRLLSECIALNSQKTSRVEHKPGANPEYFGNPTECGLIVFAQEQLAANLRAIRDDPQFNYEEPVKEFPFSSARKKMSFVHPLEGGGFRVFSKGASERILAVCTNYVNIAEAGAAGDVPTSELTDDLKARIQADVIDVFAAEGLRTLSLAYKDLPADTDVAALDEATAEEGLTLLGVAGIKDPVRPEVPPAIERCRKAGIGVMMVTGDHISTAKAIAMECGILDDKGTYVAMEGREFRRRVLVSEDGDVINQEEFNKIWPRLRVLARSSPKDKFTLVRGLQNSSLFREYRADPAKFVAEHGVHIYPDRQVVAVTGDGTNDAPALSKADVGFAMGIQGTNVAKTACDIVLMDDNFNSIVQACMWGRNVYDSVAKFLQFQLTVNISAIIVASVGAVWLTHSPLTAVQMLWVNLIMDSFASLALATEKPTPELLDRKPYGRNRAIISRQMWFNMIGQAVYQLIIVLWMLADGENVGAWEIPKEGRSSKHSDPPTMHFTMLFNTFVLMQLFNELNSRKLYGEWNVFSGIQTNNYFLVIIVGTLGAQILIVQFGGRPFNCVDGGLNLNQWLWCILLGVLSLPWQFVINFVVNALPEGFLQPQEFGSDTSDPSEADTDAIHVSMSQRGEQHNQKGLRLRARRSSSLEIANSMVAGHEDTDARASALVAVAHNAEVRRTLSGRDEDDGSA